MLCPHPQSCRVGAGDWVIASVGIADLGLDEIRVDGDELAGARVVVAVDAVDQASRVGVAAGVAKGCGGGQAAAGFGVAPRLVAGGARESPGTVDGPAHGAER